MDAYDRCTNLEKSLSDSVAFYGRGREILDHTRIALTSYRAIVYSLPLLQDNTIPSFQLRLHRKSPFSTQQK